MKRLIEGLGKNTPEEYNQIFWKRKENGIDSFDLQRWKILLHKYQGGRLIDLGCLDSLVTILAKEKDPQSEVWAIDIAREALQEMRDKYPQVLWEYGDVYETHFPSSFFNYAVAGELLEHLEYPDRFLKETFRILKPQGVLALSVPLEEEIGEVDAERHLWKFSVQDIKDLAKSYGKIKVRVFPYVHIPFLKYRHKVIIAYITKQ